MNNSRVKQIAVAILLTSSSVTARCDAKRTSSLCVDGLALGMSKDKAEQILAAEGYGPVLDGSGYWYASGSSLVGSKIGPWVRYDRQNQVAEIIGTRLTLLPSYDALRDQATPELVKRWLGEPDREIFGNNKVGEYDWVYNDIMLQVKFVEWSKSPRVYSYKIVADQ